MAPIVGKDIMFEIFNVIALEKKNGKKEKE